MRKVSLVIVTVLTLIVTSLVAPVAGQSGPFASQIQIALRAFKAAAQTFTGGLTVSSTLTMGGPILFSPDASFDIGGNGVSRPANIWASGQVNSSTINIRSGSTGKFAWSSGNAWAAGATPTISSGFGTSPSIVGASSVFRVTLGTPVGQSGVVLFNNSPAFGSVPVVTCRDETTQTANPPTYTVTASQVTITFTTAVAADTIGCTVYGLP